MNCRLRRQQHKETLEIQVKLDSKQGVLLLEYYAVPYCTVVQIIK